MSYRGMMGTGLGTMYATAGMGTLYATAGLGAIDRLATNRTRTFVFSITSVPGLPSGTAGMVPDRIKQYMGANGLTGASAGWAEGGRVWGRMYFSIGNPLVANDAERRRKLVLALTQAARSLGPSVRFEVAGYGTIPSAGPSPTPPPSTTIELEEIAVSGGGVTKSVRELQQLLLRKGFNPGRVDNTWGDNTAGALRQAAEAVGMVSQAVGSSDRRSVSINSSLWDAISALPDRPITQPERHPPAPPAPAPVSDEVVPVDEGVAVEQWLPWVLGGAALLGLGGYFWWRGQKGGGARRPAMARNRRRRRRSSRRRRRRR